MLKTYQFKTQCNGDIATDNLIITFKRQNTNEHNKMQHTDR